jgi:MFS family permease
MSQDATPFQPHDAGPKGAHDDAAAHAQSPDGRTPFVPGPHDSSSAGRAPQAPEVPDVLEASDGQETLDEAGVSEPPQLDRRQLIVALAGVLLSILLAALDQTIVGTALPRIVAELNGFDRYSWVVTAYLLTATCVIPIAGKLSDQFGRKPILLFGIVVFVGGSMLCGASQTMNELIVFRGIQGIGAGALQSGAFASIGDLFSPAERGRWQGVIAATFGIASVFGPSLGGWITDNPGWRWVFYVNVPVSIVALLTVLLGFPAARAWQRGNRIDWLGVTTVHDVALGLAAGRHGAGLLGGDVRLLLPGGTACPQSAAAAGPLPQPDLLVGSRGQPVRRAAFARPGHLSAAVRAGCAASIRHHLGRDHHAADHGDRGV